MKPRTRDIPWHRRIAIAFSAIVLALAVAAPLVHAQGQATGQLPGSAPGTYGPPFTNNNGHWVFGNGAPPVVSTCGTSPSTVVGTDTAFHFITGSSASSACTITPAVSFALRPTCIIGTDSATKPSYTVSVAGVIVMGSVQDSTRYSVVCFAQPGGL